LGLNPAWKRLAIFLSLSFVASAQEIYWKGSPLACPCEIRDGKFWAPLADFMEALKLDASEKPVSAEGAVGDPPWIEVESFWSAWGGRSRKSGSRKLVLLEGGVDRSDPGSFFISQARSSSNPSGALDNGNCGPACLAMAARALGKWPAELPSQDYPGMLSWCRFEMGHRSPESEGTNIPWLVKPAAKLGLQTELTQEPAEIDRWIEGGRLVIVAGALSDLQMPGGTHALLVVGSYADDYLVNDPGLFFKLPGSRIKKAALQKFVKLGIAVFSPASK
jgi:hypothetical protein